MSDIEKVCQDHMELMNDGIKWRRLKAIVVDDEFIAKMLNTDKGQLLGMYEMFAKQVISYAIKLIEGGD